MSRQSQSPLVLLAVLAYAGDNEAARTGAAADIERACRTFMRGDSKSLLIDTAAALAARKGAKAKEAHEALSAITQAATEFIQSGVIAGTWPAVAPRVKGGRDSLGVDVERAHDVEAARLGGEFLRLVDERAAARKAAAAETRKANAEAKQAAAGAEVKAATAVSDATPSERLGHAVTALAAMPALADSVAADWAADVVRAIGAAKALALAEALNKAAAPVAAHEAAQHGDAAPVDAPAADTAPATQVGAALAAALAAPVGARQRQRKAA